MRQTLRLFTAMSTTLVLCLSACSESDTVDSMTTTERPATTAETPAATAIEPSLTTVECSDDLPIDPRLTCATLTVALDRTSTDDNTTDLFVAIIEGTNVDLHDPVIYLSGGPGGTGVTPGRANRYLTSDPTGGRTVVLFDQRGTGRSGPDLACPEVGDAVFTMLQTPTRRADVAPDAVAAGFRACHDRLVDSGVDLDQINSEVTADDVDDLRVALGADQVNLFGVSYGTTVALAALQRHPEHLRSVVIDSVLPTDSPDTAANLVERFDHGRSTLFDACRADATCNTTHPDLDETLERVVQRFDETPYPVVSSTDVGDITVQITGADVAAGLLRAQYDEAFVPQIPALIGALDRGETAIIDVLASSGLDFWLGIAPGAAASVQCADRRLSAEQKAENSQTQRDAALAHPDLALFLTATSLLAYCDFWDVTPVSDNFASTAPTEVPTLVLAGTFDPITPAPRSGETAAALGKAATFVEIRNGGHGAVYATDCATSLFSAFLAAPDTSLDTACVDAVLPPAWS